MDLVVPSLPSDLLAPELLVDLLLPAALLALGLRSDLNVAAPVSRRDPDLMAAKRRILEIKKLYQNSCARPDRPIVPKLHHQRVGIHRIHTQTDVSSVLLVTLEPFVPYKEPSKSSIGRVGPGRKRDPDLI